MTNIVDESGNGVVRYKYDDFGETTKLGDTDFNNEICYTSGVYDELTKEYYLNARFYNPEDKVFTTQDSYRGEQKDYHTWNMYAYCGGNPINYIDPSGHLSYSITIGQYKGEAEVIKKVLKEKYNGKAKLRVTNTHRTFKTKWNKMSKKKISCVVIDSHGNPNELGGNYGETTLISKGQVKSLKKKNIKKLILLGCNVGHQAYKKSNIATYFAKKITGKLVASDGTVYSDYEHPKMNSTFVSKNDKTWKMWCGKQKIKKNKGWVKYKKDKVVSHSKDKSMTIRELCNM